MEIQLINSECLEAMRQMPDNSIDSIVTDPPYGLSFMGKKWDYEVPSIDIWKEALRVLKPGGYLLSFAGTRTQHRMACNIEDAGFEIRDMIAWVYGSGFPKSHNIGKAVDKLQGNEREVVGEQKLMGTTRRMKGGNFNDFGGEDTADIVNLTKDTSEYEGWGTALKPALEPITVARKPLSEKTVVKNVLKWGTGGINIDECRVGGKLDGDPNRFSKTDGGWGVKEFHNEPVVRSEGRFPANLIHDGSEEVVSGFPDSKSTGGSGEKFNIENRNVFSKGLQPKPKHGKNGLGLGDSGSNARFFYCAKASQSERNEGCEELEEKFAPKGNNIGRDMSNLKNHLGGMQSSQMKNNHPTVKPIKLMQYLVRLVTPMGGTVLDPFMGSGSTGIACRLEGFGFIGIEMDEGYYEIANKRINCKISDEKEIIKIGSDHYEQQNLF